MRGFFLFRKSDGTECCAESVLLTILSIASEGDRCASLNSYPIDDLLLAGVDTCLLQITEVWVRFTGWLVYTESGSMQ